MISIYSIIWSVIICGIMSLTISRLRKKTEFLQKYGTIILMVLFVCTAARIIIPLEFPFFQYIINDSLFYSAIMKPYFLIDFSPKVFNTVMIAWFCGAAFFTVHFLMKYYRTKSLLEKETIGEDPYGPDMLSAIDPDCSMDVLISSGTPVPVLVGIFHPAIYLPVYTCDHPLEDLHYIILHEYTHWKRKDLLKKFLINLFCAIFWWNPFVYLLRRELNYLIEFNCDHTLSQPLDDYEVIEYLRAMKGVMNSLNEEASIPYLHIIAFVPAKISTTIEQRFDLLLYREKEGKWYIKYGSFLLIFLLMAASYYFLPQTKYEIPEEEMWEDDVKEISNTKTSYIEKTKDGHYYFHFENYVSEIPAKEIKSNDDYFSIYPIIETDNDSSMYENK